MYTVRCGSQLKLSKVSWDQTMFKLDLEKTEIKQPTSIGSSKNLEFQKNIYFCFIDYAKDLVWITENCGKFLKGWKYQTTRPAS